MMAEFNLKFHHSAQKYFFSKHQNKVILAISLLISKTEVVLKTSVTSMTSSDVIKSLASMTSTASLASKSQKLLAGWFPCHQEPQIKVYFITLCPGWPCRGQYTYIIDNALSTGVARLLKYSGSDSQDWIFLWIFTSTWSLFSV